MREGLKGHHFEDEEVSTELMYWSFAHHFGFTPEQVDRLPYDRMVYFLELETESKKLEKIALGK